MNYKEYFKTKLMEEMINEVALTDVQRQDPVLGNLERRHADIVHVLMHLFNENPHLFKSENARGRLINLGNQLGMNVGSKYDRSIEGERERGVLFPNNTLPIYSHDPLRRPSTEVNIDTPISLTGRTEQERLEAERIGRHERGVRNEIRARRNSPR